MNFAFSMFLNRDFIIMIGNIYGLLLLQANENIISVFNLKTL